MAGRLFGWDAVTASVFAEYYNPDGFVPDDTGAILGLFKDGYLIHQGRRRRRGGRSALSRPAEPIKVRHSRHSRLRLAEARQALAIVHTIADDFAAQVTELTATTVTDRQWARFLDAHIGDATSARSRTIAGRKRDTLNGLWNSDVRVTPWRGTAWGVIQAVNTYTHHEQTVRGADRPERNMLRAVEGGTDTLDTTTLSHVLT